MNIKNSNYYLGVDGGGTKTAAVIADREGNVLGDGLDGPVNLAWVDRKTARNCLKRAVEKAFKNSGISPQDISCAYLGMAGVKGKNINEKRKPIFTDELHSLGVFSNRIIVDNDAFLGLVSTISLKEGIVVVAGTGFNAKGINSKGERIHLPYYVAERGAGHIIGRLAAKESLFSLLGVSETTLLAEKIMNILDFNEIDQLVEWLSTSRASYELGQLTPAVTQAAEAGDFLAQKLLNTAGKELGLAAVIIARKAGFKKCRVGIVGGVFKAGEYILEPMKDVLTACNIEAKLVPPFMPPAGGAIILAWKEDGHNPGRVEIDKLSCEVSAALSSFWKTNQTGG